MNDSSQIRVSILIGTADTGSKTAVRRKVGTRNRQAETEVLEFHRITLFINILAYPGAHHTGISNTIDSDGDRIPLLAPTTDPLIVISREPSPPLIMLSAVTDPTVIKAVAKAKDGNRLENNKNMPNMTNRRRIFIIESLSDKHGIKNSGRDEQLIHPQQCTDPEVHCASSTGLLHHQNR